MAKKTEPIGDTGYAQPDQLLSPGKIRTLYNKLRVARMRAEGDETGLMRGFSVQEELDKLTEQYGEDVVAELRKELEKPKKGQPDVHAPSRILEKIDIIKDPKTGELHVVSIWNTGEDVIDVNYDIWDKNILATIYSAASGIKEKILSSLRAIREGMLYPETGNDIQLIYVVRKDPASPNGYSVFLKYPSKDAMHEKEVTQIIPEHVLKSLQKTGAGNTDKEFQKWVQGLGAKAAKVDTGFVFNDLLKNDTTTSDLLSQTPKKEYAEWEKEEKSKGDAETKAKDVAAAEKAREEAEKKAAEEKKRQEIKDQLEKDIREKEKAKVEARAILDGITLPDHLKQYREDLEKDRGKNGLSLSDMQKIISLYEKWQENEKIKAEAAAKAEAEKKAKDAAAEKEAKAKAKEEAKAKAKKDKEDAEAKAKEDATKKAEEEAEKKRNEPMNKRRINLILAALAKAEGGGTDGEKDAGKENFRRLTGEEYTQANVEKYEKMYETYFGKPYPKSKEQAEAAKKEREAAEAKAKTDAEAKTREDARAKAEAKRKEKADARAKKDAEESAKRAQEEAAIRAREAARAKAEKDKEDTEAKRRAEETAKKKDSTTPPGGRPPEDGGVDDFEDDPEEDIPSQERGLTQQERWQEALAGVARIIGGTLLTLSGLRFLKTVTDYWKESGTIKENQEVILTELEKMSNAQAKTESASGIEEETEREAAIKEAQEEEIAATKALEERIQKLIKNKTITEKDAEGLRAELQKIIDKSAEEKSGITRKMEDEILRTLNLYIQRRVTKSELLKQGLNVTFVLTGLQTARALSYAGLSVYQRAQRRLAQNEQLIREGRETEVQSIWKDLTTNAYGELREGVKNIAQTAHGLFTDKYISRAEWATQTQSAGRALGNLMIFAGMAGIAGAEWHGTGSLHQIDVLQHKIDILQNNFEIRELGQMIADNFLLRFHTSNEPSSEQPDGTPPNQPEQPHEVPSDTGGQEQPPIQPPPVEHQPQNMEEFYKENPLLRHQHGATPTEYTYAQSATAYQQEPELVRTPVLEYASTTPNHQILHDEISFGIHGDYQQLDQYLRRLAVDSMDEKSLHGHGTFDHIDAARVENVVANMRNALLGREDTPLNASQLHGIAHFSGKELVIDNYMEFSKLAHTLFGHAEQTITDQSGALHYIDNTAHGVWQKMWDIKMQGAHHVPVEDFSRYHHVPVHHEAPPHTPILDHKETPDTNPLPAENPPVIAPLNPIATSPEASASPSFISPESTGSISTFTTEDTHGVPHTVILEQTPLVPTGHEATSSAETREVPQSETAATSPQGSASVEPKLVIHTQEAPPTGAEQWTLQTFFEKFTANKFDASFIEGAHEHPDVFALFFMDRLAELRHTYGQDYFKYLTQENIHDAAENTGSFRMNISELIEGVLHHKKDVIHLNLGHDFTTSATPKE